MLIYILLIGCKKMFIVEIVDSFILLICLLVVWFVIEIVVIRRVCFCVLN